MTFNLIIYNIFDSKFEIAITGDIIIFPKAKLTNANKYVSSVF